MGGIFFVFKKSSSLPEQTYTQFSEPEDGYIELLDVDWNTTRDGTVGDSAFPSSTTPGFIGRVFNWDDAGPSFTISRSFFEFDLTAIPSTGRTVKSVQLQVTGITSAESTIMIQESTATDSASSVNNFGSFTGPGFMDTGFTWTLGNNLMTLNAAGIAYIQSKMGSVAKFCLREYDHDFLDVPSGVGGTTNTGYFLENTAGSFPDLKTPKLIITYEKEEVWTSIFDNTKWSEDWKGTWNGAQSRWESEDGGQLYIVTNGTWPEGYRPSKIRITFSWVSNSDSMWIDLYANTDDWNNLTDPGWASGPFANASGEEFTLAGSNHDDIFELDLYSDNNNEFYVTNIEFLEP